MPYSAEISRANPSCFLFLLDQSGSMADPLAGEAGKRKADKVADVINKFLQNLVIKCGKNEGVRNYFHVGVLGYGANGVRPAFSGSIAGREMVPISEIADFPARIEERSKKVDDGAGGLVETKVKFPIWFDTVANGGTPMDAAMKQAHKIISDWTTKNPTCFPPIVINVTDGESTDADPSAAADALKALATTDGNVLLFNAHVSSSPVAPILFPDAEATLPDDYARLLFRMSSVLTDNMQSGARQEGITVSASSKGFVFNANFEALINFIDIGTLPGNLR